VVSFTSLKNRYTRGYLLRRGTNSVLVFFGMLLINFALPRLMPGNFAEIYLATMVQDTRSLGVSKAKLEQELNAQLGLGRPLLQQFTLYVSQIFSFPPSFGKSFQFYPTPAWNIVFYSARWTLLLLGLSQALSWGFGVLVGAYMGLHKGTKVDRFLQPVMVFMLTIPPFWLGLMFIFLFAIDLRILPPVGAYGLTPTLPGILLHLVLPVSVLVISNLPEYAIVFRNTVLEVLSSDFIMAIKAQGLRRTTFYSALIRNSMLPTLTQLFLSLGTLMGGIYTVEYTFSYPGMGTVIATAVFSRDFPVLEAALFLTALAIIIFNLFADLIYPLIDPRISYVS
jgi:peptide/nickel transport system permease protein